jgi:hypothetical protein
MTVQTTADLRVVLALVEERQARLRRTSLLVSATHATRRPVRRWIGRQLVRFGAWVAAEPTMRPARAR